MKKQLTGLLFLVTLSFVSSSSIVLAADECAADGYLWEKIFPASESKWGSYGQTPKEAGYSSANAGLFCSPARVSKEYWPRRMWHNYASWLLIKCKGVNCGRPSPYAAVPCDPGIPKTLYVTKNGDYKLCVQENGSKKTKEVHVNWLDFARPEITDISPGKNINCTYNGNPYNGDWVQDQVDCKIRVKDNSGHDPSASRAKTDTPGGLRVADARATVRITPGSELKPSKIKKALFTGAVFDLLPGFDKDRDMLSIEETDLLLEFKESIDFDTRDNPSNPPMLTLMDYAGNKNLVPNRRINDFRVRIDREPPSNEGLKCYSRNRNNRVKPYTGVASAEFPGGWTKHDVDCSYELKDSISHIKEWRSSVSPRPYASEVWVLDRRNKDVALVNESNTYRISQNESYVISGKSKDRAGNETPMGFPTYNIKIDRIPLAFDDGIRMKSTQSGDNFRRISSSRGSPTKFEAHEAFIMDLGIKEPDSRTESAIDWDNSWISISHTPAPGTTRIGGWIERPLNSAGLSAMNATIDKSQQLIYFNDSSDVFEKAGEYTLQFYLIDEAGNAQVPPYVNRYIKVVPSEVAGTDAGSILRAVEQPQRSKKYANNNDTRRLGIRLKDRFQNDIRGRRIDIRILDQDTVTSTYDLTDKDAFVWTEGLRFATGNEQKFTYVAPQYFDIKSFTPSTSIVYSEDGLGAIFAKEKDAFGNYIGGTVLFEVDGPDIDPQGNPRGSRQVAVNLEANVAFSPIIYGYMTQQLLPETNINYSTIRARKNSILEIALGEVFPFFTYTNSTGSAPGGRALPSNYKVLVQSHSSPGLAFAAADYKEGDLVERAINFIGGGIQEFQPTQTTPYRGGGIVRSPIFGFSSKIEVSLGSKRVIYPGGNLGNKLSDSKKLFDTDVLCEGDLTTCPDWFNNSTIEVIAIEADVEGSILGSQYSFTQDESVRGGNSKILTMGGVSAQDIREEITRNAYELTRGVEVTSNTDRRMGIDFNTGHNIIYVKNGTLTLGGVISGVGTIILEDSNIIIENDMSYANQSDSLGIILVNSTTSRTNNEEGPLSGNIYIRPDVQNIVGTYFADGSIMSIGRVGIDTNLSADLRKTQLTKQLLIQGTIFTKNTLGGVIGETTGSDDNRTPWATLGRSIADIQVAMKYDLHWLRRYRPGGAFKNPATNSNEHATVIRPDGKVKNITPPGFGVRALIRR